PDQDAAARVTERRLAGSRLGSDESAGVEPAIIERWSSSSLPSAIRLACGAAKGPTKPPFSPAVTENGRPLRRVKMPLARQPPRIQLATPSLARLFPRPKGRS